MELKQFLSKKTIIVGVAEMVAKKYTNPVGACEIMSADLVKELSKRGISARHVVGIFRLDEPDARKYIDCDCDEGRDEYEVEHDWVEVGGKILDISAKQFRNSVYDKIPDIIYIGQAEPFADRYEMLNYHA